MEATMQKHGQKHSDERRVHKVFVTRNTEYHVRRNLCVGVRDRKSGRWMRGHIALRSEVAGGLSFLKTGGVRASDSLPGVGESLFFCRDGRDLVTSAIVSVERPVRAIVSTYEA
jgi:hypothetical protein